MEHHNEAFIKQQHKIIESFSTKTCNRCESTAITYSVDNIEETMLNAVEHLIHIVRTETTAYDSSIYKSLLSMNLVSNYSHIIF
jgi:hypothetical protein